MRKFTEIHPGCLRIHDLIVDFHALIDTDGVYLIDAGWMFGIERLETALSSYGRRLTDIHDIILSHGHLDHTANVSRLQYLTNSTVHAPRLDADHIAGKGKYRGWSRVGGCLEAIGRIAHRYQPPKVDHWFDPGQQLLTWGGLQVVALPGHTIGHCGFYSERTGLLFANDLASNWRGVIRRPPRSFNTHPELIDSSLRKAQAIKASQVLLCHGRPTTSLALADLLSPELA